MLMIEMVAMTCGKTPGYTPLQHMFTSLLTFVYARRRF